MPILTDKNTNDFVNQVTAWKPSNQWDFDPKNKFVGTNIKLADGQVVPYDAVVQQILKKYDVDLKNPALAVKSAIQLGIPEDVIKTLPGVDSSAFSAGKN